MNMIEELEEYFKNTPREKIEAAWNELSYLDNVGPTVDEFIIMNMGFAPISFEEAKELKEKGFSEPCHYWYSLFHKELNFSIESKNFNSFIVTKEATYHSSSYSAPSKNQYNDWITKQN